MLTKLNIKKGSLSSNLHFTISSKGENFKYQNTIIGNNMFRIKGSMIQSNKILILDFIKVLLP